MLKTRLQISVLILLLATHSLFGQNKYKLVFKGADSLSAATIPKLGLANSFPSSMNSTEYVYSLVALLQAKGYVTASIDSLQTKGDTSFIQLYTDHLYRWAALTASGVEEKLLDAVGWRPKMFDNKPMDFSQVQTWQERFLSQLENTGYPFAKVFLDSFHLDEDKVTALLKVNKGPLYKIDSCAIALGSEGCELVINGRNARQLTATADEVEVLTGRRPTTVVADISTDEGRHLLLAACTEPDILVTNNGGPRPGRPDDWDHAAWLHALEANMLSAILLIQAVVGGMRCAAVRADHQHHVGDGEGAAPAALSTAARAGLTAFSKALSVETVRDNVTINNLLPERIETDRLRYMIDTLARTTGGVLLSFYLLTTLPRLYLVLSPLLLVSFVILPTALLKIDWTLFSNVLLTPPEPWSTTPVQLSNITAFLTRYGVDKSPLGWVAAAAVAWQCYERLERHGRCPR